MYLKIADIAGSQFDLISYCDTIETKRVRLTQHFIWDVLFYSLMIILHYTVQFQVIFLSLLLTPRLQLCVLNTERKREKQNQ